MNNLPIKKLKHNILSNRVKINDFLESLLCIVSLDEAAHLCKFLAHFSGLKKY